MEAKNVTAFYEFVESTYGVDRSWIILQEWKYGLCLPKQQDCSTFGNIIGQPDADPNLVVPDPKSLIRRAWRLSHLSAGSSPIPR